MTTPTPIAPITAQSLLRELIPVSEQQRKAIDTACDALDALERDLAQAREELAELRAEKEAGQLTAIADVYAKACLERFEKAEAERDAAVKALVRVRAHTGYSTATADFALLVGLLENIERIVDAAIDAARGKE